MSTASSETRLASWRERSATFVVFLTLGLVVGAWAAALPGLKLKLDLTTGEFSLALFALSVGSVFSTVCAGFVMPHYGTGRTTGFAAMALAGAFALTPLASSLAQFVAAGFVVGCTTGILDVAVNGHAGDIEKRWGGPIMSSFHGAFSLGGLLGSSLGGLMVWAGIGVEAQVWISALLVALCNLPVLPSLGGGQAGHAASGGLSWPNRTMLGLCVVIMFCFIIEGAMADWSAVYLATVTGSSLAVAAAGYAGFSVTMAAGRLSGDKLISRFGPRVVVGAGGLLAAVGLAIAVIVAKPAAAILGFVFVGIGAANIVPAVCSAAVRSGRSATSGIALVTAVGYAGFLSGPPLIGSIAAWAGLRFAFVWLVAAAALTAVTGFIVFGRYKKGF